MWPASNISSGNESAANQSYSRGDAVHDSAADRMGLDIGGVDAFRTLFLGDLSYFCTEEDLCSIFAPFGHISTVRVRRGVTGESLMHGFIALDSHEAAKRAIAELDGKMFMGRNIRYLLYDFSRLPITTVS